MTEEIPAESTPATEPARKAKTDYCPGCGKDKRVKDDGTFFAHDKQGRKAVVDPCPWSGKNPSGPPPEPEHVEALQRATAGVTAPPVAPSDDGGPSLEGNSQVSGDPEDEPGEESVERLKQRTLEGEVVAPEVKVDRKKTERLVFTVENGAFMLSISKDDLGEVQDLGPGSREARAELMRRVRAQKGVMPTTEAYARDSAKLLDRAFNTPL